MERLSRVLQTSVDASVIPGAVALVRHRGETVFHEAFGHAATEPEARPMRIDTIFDLASLTKPLVGATVTLSMVDRGILSLDEEVTGFLPELERMRGHGVTFRRLLCHTSGLAAWRPLYVWARDTGGILEAIDRLGFVTQPGTDFAYSDIGFIVLGLAVQRAGDRSLDELATETVFEPLGLQDTGYLPSAGADAFAVTERGNAFERQMAEDAGMAFDGWRREFHPGEVNDGNAHYGLAGVSAHAGLFSTAHDLGVLGEMWRDGGVTTDGPVLSYAARDLAGIDQTPDEFGRGLGWQLMRHRGPIAEDPAGDHGGSSLSIDRPWSPSSSGELLSSAAYGHTGFTGTSIWIDPSQELVVVLLTNATHPRVDVHKPLNALRARFHNAVVASFASASPRTGAP